MATLRSKETEQRYREYRRARKGDEGCVLCEKEAIQSFTHWKIVENLFPYDRIAKMHHMIIPKRHVAEEGLNEEEMKEIGKIKKKILNVNYDGIIETTPAQKTVPDHFHLHLVVIK